MSFGFVLFMWKQVSLRAIWLVFTSVAGIEGVGGGWGVCLKLVNNPQTGAYVYIY